MEVLVSFTDGSADLNGAAGEGGKPAYITDESVLGRVWISAEGLVLTPPVRIRYEKHPWMEKFEFDGIRAVPAKRTGIGTRGAKDFVKSLSTIYSEAYSDYNRYGGDEAFDAAGYFGHAAGYFARIAEDDNKRKIAAKFCGFAENLWREGDREMLDVCIDTVLPVIERNPHLGRIFRESITGEFSSWIKRERQSWQRTRTEEK